MSNGTIYQLDLAEHVERVSAEIYRLAAARFAPGSEAVRLFEQLAAEEDQHLARVQLLRSQYVRRPAAFGDSVVDTSALEAALVEAATVVRLLRDPSHALSFEEVKQLMIGLEQTFAVAHAHLLTNCPDPGVRYFFEQMALQDQGHAALLGPPPGIDRVPSRSGVSPQ